MTSNDAQHSNQPDREKWQSEQTLAAWRFIVEKRLELIERTVRALNAGRSVDSIQASSKTELAMALMKLANSDKDEVVGLARSLEARLKLDEMTTEIATVALLDGIYFGPKTKDALKKLYANNPDWWKMTDEDKTALSEAMVQELNHGQPLSIYER